MSCNQTTMRVRVGLRGQAVEPALVPPDDAEIPRIVRLLALAHRWHRLIDVGKVKDQAEIARETGLTRARVTQIMGMVNLNPVARASGLCVRSCMCPERRLREVVRSVYWPEQLQRMMSLLEREAKRR